MKDKHSVEFVESVTAKQLRDLMLLQRKITYKSPDSSEHRNLSGQIKGLTRALKAKDVLIPEDLSEVSSLADPPEDLVPAGTSNQYRIFPPDDPTSFF